ncbi:MAG: hypothetical protein WAN48_06825 [Actinomycetes bacterium]
MDRQLTRLVVVLGWITVTLFVDSTASAAVQNTLGALTWLLLVTMLARETSLVRLQVAVVVAFATAVEYTFSEGLEVYVYRLGHVPTYVPPGHGLVYLGALAFARLAWARRHERGLLVGAALAVSAYAAFGLSPLAARPDVLGAFWAACLVAFIVWGRSRLVYVGAVLVVTYLELVGTGWGDWAWGSHDPTGWVTIGNPPSGAAGGYGWFDLAALLLAPVLLGAWRSAVVGRRTAEHGQHVVVQPTVGAHGVAAGQGA